MKNEKKIEVITIKGMCEKFQVSTMTLYRNYLPRLQEVASEGRKKFYSYTEAKAVHDELTGKLKNFKIIA